MKRIKWYLRKIKNMDYQHFFKILKEISEDTHRLRIIILLDMFICSIRYGAGYVDYYEYEFYLMNHKERRTYMTISINKQMVERYNDKKQAYKLHDKGVFNELFNEFLGREWINLEVSDKEAFKQFLKHKDKIIVKPNRDCSGHGIEIISIDKKTNSDELYDQLVNNKQCLVEEVIENHKDIKKIYDQSLNTLRIISFRRDDQVFILARILKFGNGGVLDNFAAGGMYTFVDEKGVVYAAAIDKDGNTFEEHPITKFKFRGFKVPYFKETIELVKKAALVVPEIPYVGWDIAVTEKGPVIIEGNQTSGIFQLKASLNPTKTGSLPVYNEAMHFFKNKKF
jgi:glutathione synthase/RimK-type ligase-like ATP-grasp enzyme